METKTKEPETKVIGGSTDPMGTMSATELVPVELAKEERLALEAARQAGDMMAVLQRMEDAAKILERRTELLGKIRRLAIRETNPVDWVLFQNNDGNVVAMLADSGAKKVAGVFGISTFNSRPKNPRGELEPLTIPYRDGRLGLRMWVDGHSVLTGARVDDLEVNIRSDEEFTGRRVDADTDELKSRPAKGDPAAEGDLRASLGTRARTKVTRICSSLTNVPVEELEACWEGQSVGKKKKSAADCRKGHGFGSSTERSAGAVADTGVKARANLLGKTLLQLTGGDQTEAKDLLRSITKNDKKDFKGFMSCDRFTKDWQIDQAWEALAIDPVFGDRAPSELEAANQKEGNGEND